MLISVCSLLASAGSALAKDKQGKGKAKGKVARVTRVERFAPADRTVIVEYCRAQPGGLPPGLASREELPPGLAKQLRRNGQLPPGLQKKLIAFPPDLHTRLAPLPAGYERGFIGHFAVVWNRGTQVIVDVIALR